MRKQDKLRKIAAEIEHCALCRKGGTGKAVPGEGTGETPVMFVGEAPGRTEASSGRPFIGRSGRFLRRMIAEIGLDDAKVFITSPVHYLPDAGRLTADMIEHGRVHLIKQIAVIRPRVIVLLGSTACRALLETVAHPVPGSRIEVAKHRGSVLDIGGIRYVITFHPAYAMRFPEGRKKFIRDFAAVKDLLSRT